MAHLKDIQKHPDLWFEDGNVVLIAGTTGFRVYRGLLVRQSDVFRDMFSLPQPSSLPIEDTYEGCPLVCLRHDDADELAKVLTIIYGGGQSFYDKTHPIDFATAAAGLRIGTKYSFMNIRQEALRRISTCYPAELHAMQTHGPGLQATGLHCTSNCPITWDAEDCIAVFHLARCFNLNELIPAALYRCTTHVSISSLFAAAADQDNQLHTLSQEELEDCIQAREVLFIENARLYNIFSELEPSPDCTDSSRTDPVCVNAMKNMLANAHKENFMHQNHPLVKLDHWIAFFQDSEHHSHTICDSCVSYFTIEARMRQKQIWIELRTRFCS
ncbi:hypothetical protein BDY19DRAFT_449067 [Irpex rosettiformis]|uniref:Uncharacterized protein n=1 Tax=Irpex rosettiformis TaxID=378272 RepID=A0ACB8TTY4_9APHY|nr:hypothetical protein BDY19DRAFT_449067 [Irpex rosettiformis]